MAEKRLKVELIDPQKLIKVNELQEVTNPDSCVEEKDSLSPAQIPPPESNVF